ncbi:TetR/AcrR family transcriptional regulator [Vibrionales bacterium C3R12]|uniref:TetR/AcrR family transcriptional regulator n=1 Tax=Vibrio sp. 03-59-1 TaxID=2607607 RepID=UPI000DE9495F|nr:TetR family transcriptional regulator [Vibrio sp. 03-59-1]NOH82178.1 helix-turn-helix transcriptional regulator [Vibrio sp. 03-59-1]RBW64514.1 TetR/AcrR family transcriptional regulator [Vibrionales bacterium C3R12]
MSVKEKKRGRPKGVSNQLSADTIIDMAKSLMRAEGKIPSIRKLASHLDVDAMAIYHYFSNKNTLLESITTSLIEDIYEPQAINHWKLELKELCTSYLALLNNYSGLLETLLGMSSDSPAAVFIERFHVVVAPLNLSDESTKNALDLLVDYLHGFALALNCSVDVSKLNIDMLEGPLNMYCIALENA